MDSLERADQLPASNLFSFLSKMITLKWCQLVISSDIVFIKAVVASYFLCSERDEIKFVTSTSSLIIEPIVASLSSWDCRLPIWYLNSSPFTNLMLSRVFSTLNLLNIVFKACLHGNLPQASLVVWHFPISRKVLSRNTLMITLRSHLELFIPVSTFNKPN